MSNESGKEFEKLVRDILVLQGKIVEGEKRVAGKKIDLAIHYYEFSKQIHVAVECKNYSKKLSRKDVTEIKAEYEDVLASGDISRLLIVTCHGISPDAYKYIEYNHNLYHQTLTELQSDVMNFKNYLQYLIRLFKDDCLNEYFISPTYCNGNDLTSTIVDWINKNEQVNPIAIVGGYGLGKTSFAKWLASHAAEKALYDQTSRIPILIELKKISTEYSIEGLLAKIFTADFPDTQYNFLKFSLLNDSGRFIIIFDGFDEMKHTLSWDEFESNFSQIIQLHGPKSKVIVLGRPNVFIDDGEYIHAIRGVRQIAGREIKVTNWPEFTEYRLDEFDDNKVLSFLESYLTVMIRQQNLFAEDKKLGHRKNKLVENIKEKRMDDLVRRPVQLKMLADILPDFDGDTSKLTRCLLYDAFIHHIVKREVDKGRVRQGIDLKKRRLFAQRIALWLWDEKHEQGTKIWEIPQRLLEGFIKKDEEFEHVKRDLLASCMLERKLGEAYYFPHRSFQEFLIAEHISSHLIHDEFSHEIVNRILNHEIIDFSGQLLDNKASQLFIWFQKMNRFHGIANDEIFRLLFSCGVFKRRVEVSLRAHDTALEQCTWYPILLAYWIGVDRSGRNENQAALRKFQKLSDASKENKEIFVVISCYIYALISCDGANLKKIKQLLTINKKNMMTALENISFSDAIIGFGGEHEHPFITVGNPMDILPLSDEKLRLRSAKIHNNTRNYESHKPSLSKEIKDRIASISVMSDIDEINYTIDGIIQLAKTIRWPSFLEISYQNEYLKIKKNDKLRIQEDDVAEKACGKIINVLLGQGEDEALAKKKRDSNKFGIFRTKKRARLTFFSGGKPR